MNKNILQTLFSHSLFASVAVGLVFMGRTTSAQTTLISPTVNDGGFESITAKTDFQLATSASAAIPYWGATGLATDGTTSEGVPDDEGAENDGGVMGTTGNNNVDYTGNCGAFWKGGGTATTAFNLVLTNPIAAGNVYTLTWYGRTTGTTGAQVATLFSQAPSTVTGATYTYQPTATLITADGVVDPTTYGLDTTNQTFAQYSLTYTATAADAGNLIGITYGDDGGSYIGADDFTLTVGSAVPEPSSYALLFGGLGCVFLMRRIRRAAV